MKSIHSLFKKETMLTQEKFSFKRHGKKMYAIRISPSFIEHCTYRSVVSYDEFRRELRYDLKHDRVAQYMYRHHEFGCIATQWLYIKESKIFISTFILPEHERKGFAIPMFQQLFAFWKEYEPTLEFMYTEVYVENLHSYSIQKRLFEELGKSPDGKKVIFRISEKRRDELLAVFKRKK